MLRRIKKTASVAMVVVHWVSFVLGASSLAVLLAGIAVMAITNFVLFEGFIGTFFAWAVIFAIVSEFTRPRVSREGEPDACPGKPSHAPSDPAVERPSDD